MNYNWTKLERIAQDRVGWRMLVYTLMRTDSFPRFLESSNYLSIINNFDVNKSSRKSTVLNQSKFFKNKANVSIGRMSSKISTTTNRPGKDDGKLISSQVKCCKHSSSQMNKSKIVVMHKSDKTATPTAEIKDKLNKEFNNNSFKSNLIRLKRMGIFLTVSASSTGYIPNRSQVLPPLRGSFPLDHHGVCKVAMLEWTQCMKKNHWNNSLCRSEAAGYLRCRAENNLMDPDEISLLGFTEEEWNQTNKHFDSKT
ncbi:unnamed protein product [Schistosoma margrebowiei]|uniref:Cytochrome c oxidase assembly protein COX19 n=2 Tax=Schistosoma margrebowiei TaxID=48269 RepID=A0A183M0P7_9TREM|nr:unnamed protein product [Schistosoma margrebowiei]